MKDPALTYLSLALSIVSLVYAGWIHSQGSELLAMRALRRREADLVRSLAPKFAPIYRDMLPNDPVASRPSETLEDLIAPLIKLMEGVGDGAGSATNRAAVR